MKKRIYKSIFFILLPLILISNITSTHAGITLNVPEITQEQNEWCWAGCSQATLFFYGTNVTQCVIANFVRVENSWGSDDCCITPGGTVCNQPNNMYGNTGSFQAVLVNWGVNSDARSYALSKSVVSSEILSFRPFEFRWGWDEGGGHFLVGRGVDGDIVHYMDPWPGNGFQSATYDWVKRGGNHTWTHSLQITTDLEENDCIIQLIYGNHSEEAELLRDFRDNILSQTPGGQEIIRLYYEWSPVIIKVMEEDEEFRNEIKGVVDSIIVSSLR